jgi:hypothetical protein
LLKKEKGMNKKEVIDKMTEYLIALRDMYKITPIVVQQLNRSISSMDRVKHDRVEPMLSDFAESSDTVQAANYVLALFSPYRHQIADYKGFNINSLKNRFRSLSVLKTRDGEADLIKGMAFLGEVGLIKELPKADLMTAEHYSNIMGIKKYSN